MEFDVSKTSESIQLANTSKSIGLTFFIASVLALTFVLIYSIYDQILEGSNYEDDYY